jgi:hypothetical protein
MAAVFGAAAPFTHAEPLLYSIADAESLAIVCGGNAASSKQHTAGRSADLKRNANDSDIFLSCGYGTRSN